jgi:hypothetical protein
LIAVRNKEKKCFDIPTALDAVLWIQHSYIYRGTLLNLVVIGENVTASEDFIDIQDFTGIENSKSL